MDMHAFSIKDLEHLTGIKAHTIRIWEQRYSFLQPRRTNTNIRFYSNEELKKILNISLLNKNGFKISHIDRMTDAEITDKILGLGQTEAQQERMINLLIEAMVDLDICSFEHQLTQYIRNKGIESCINHLIFPFMERIGMLWATGHINPAQEHLVSNIIRQKLIAGTEAVVSRQEKAKTGLLFLPEGEFHELGLLFVQYLLTKKGIETLYLGANVPIDDVAYVVKIKQPDFLYTHLTSVSQGFSMDKFIIQADQKFGKTPMVISGKMTDSREFRTPVQVLLKHSLQEVQTFITSL